MSQTEMKIDTTEMPKAVKPITVSTVLGFLVGVENAIYTLLRSRSTVWLGLLFVISAGFAREYDGESLLHEPWHLLIPLGASLASSLLLFSLLAATCRLSGSFNGSFWRGYRHFLGLYWMTAPLAWLYAIPIERVFSPAAAVRFNLILLAIVSLWRVLLMTRVVSVVFRCHFVSAFVLVMLFADAVALSIIYLTPTPIFSMMGGIRLTESEQVIQSAHFMVGCGGLLTGPIWLIGGLAILILAAAKKKAICTWDLETLDWAGATKPTWFVAAGSIAFGVALLPFAQPEQYNRWQVKHALAQGRIDDGLRYMAERRRSDFPPHWDPPPRIGYGDQKPKLIEVLNQLEVSGTTGWVRDIFIDKLRLQADNRFSQFFGHSFRLEDMSDEQLGRYVEMLQRMPDGDMIASCHDNELRAVNQNDVDTLTPQRRKLWKQMLAMAGRHEAKHEQKSGIEPEAPTQPSEAVPTAPSGP